MVQMYALYISCYFFTCLHSKLLHEATLIVHTMWVPPLNMLSVRLCLHPLKAISALAEGTGLWPCLYASCLAQSSTTLVIAVHYFLLNELRKEWATVKPHSSLLPRLYLGGWSLQVKKSVTKIYLHKHPWTDP